ncbi:MAG: Holliday junction resolvase Hjc [Candidatus Bathyarchaeia archaeon]
MRRGINEERELVKKFSEMGFAVIRAPSSGSSTRIDRPDLLVGGKGRHLAVEVKSTLRDTLYVETESMDQLKRFAEKFGAEPYLAVKFKRRRCGWLLLKPTSLGQTEKGFKISLADAMRDGQPPEAFL